MIFACHQGDSYPTNYIHLYVHVSDHFYKKIVLASKPGNAAEQKKIIICINILGYSMCPATNIEYGFGLDVHWSDVDMFIADNCKQQTMSMT